MKAKKFLLRWHAGYSGVIKKAIVIVSECDAWRLRVRPYRVAYKNGKPSGIEYSTELGRVKFHLAREIMDAKEGQNVRHKNHDFLDCRRENLIIVEATCPIERHYQVRRKGLHKGQRSRSIA